MISRREVNIKPVGKKGGGGGGGGGGDEEGDGIGGGGAPSRFKPTTVGTAT